MPFAVDPIHRQFFHSQGWVQFDLVLVDKQLQQAKSHVASYSQKMLEPRGYEAGRDLHLKDSWLNKCALQLGTIAAGLWNERPLLLLGDQLLHGSSMSSWTSAIAAREKAPARAIPLAYQTGLSLDEIWSAQPMLGAIVLALDSPLALSALSSTEPTGSANPSMNQLQSGSIMCLKSSMQLILPPQKGRTYWLLAFGNDQARYIKAKTDLSVDYYRQRGTPENGRLMNIRSTVIAR